MNRDMLSRRLERRGLRAAIAGGGAQGVAMTKSEKPALVLVDMSPPVMDGWSAARTLKDNPATCTKPIIDLTAHDMASGREKCLEVGGDDYDTEPGELSRLLDESTALFTKSNNP